MASVSTLGRIRLLSHAQLAGKKEERKPSTHSPALLGTKNYADENSFGGKMT